MKPRDRYILLMIVGVVAAGAITVAIGTTISVTGQFDGPELAFIIPVLLVAVLVVWALSHGGRR